jgi:hypothetical protein
MSVSPRVAGWPQKEAKFTLLLQAGKLSAAAVEMGSANHAELGKVAITLNRVFTVGS